MLKKCKNCWVKSSQVCLLGDSLMNVSEDNLLSILSSCGVTKPIHVKKELINGFAHLHFDNVKDSTTFYYAYHIKQQYLCFQLPGVVVKPALTNHAPVIYDFSFIDTAALNNSSRICICRDVANATNTSPQPFTNNAANASPQLVTNKSTNTVNESDSPQPATNATTTVNVNGSDSPHPQPVTNDTNATNTVDANELDSPQPVTYATNTENGRKRRSSELWKDDLQYSITKLRQHIKNREQAIFNERKELQMLEEKLVVLQNVYDDEIEYELMSSSYNIYKNKYEKMNVTQG